MFFGSSQVIENMERETGIEPATSSLGNCYSEVLLILIIGGIACVANVRSEAVTIQLV